MSGRLALLPDSRQVVISARRPEKITVIIMGDKSKIKDALKRLGPIVE